jgi:hypothetical protein
MKKEKEKIKEEEVENQTEIQYPGRSTWRSKRQVPPTLFGI